MSEQKDSKYSTALKRAVYLLEGDRQQNYGDPRQNYEQVATYWSTYLGMNLCPMDVAIMLALLKIGRIPSNCNHQDNYVDGAAYLSMAMEFARQDLATDASQEPSKV